MRFEMAAPVGSASDDKVHHFVTPPVVFFLLAGHCSFKSLFTSCTENAHFPLKFNLLILFQVLYFCLAVWKGCLCRTITDNLIMFRCIDGPLINRNGVPVQLSSSIWRFFSLSLFLLLLQFCRYVDLLGKQNKQKNKFCYCWDVFVQSCSVTFYSYT